MSQTKGAIMMEMLFEILPAILIPLAISIILPWIYGKSKKEENENEFITTTKYPRRFTLCSVVALIITVTLFVVGTVLICVFEKDFPIHSWIAFILSAVFIIAIPLLLTLLAFRTYEIIRTDGILVVRLFKNILVKYFVMASYHFSSNQLTVYDNQHKVLFGVYDNRVGLKSLLNQLDIKGIFRE